MTITRKSTVIRLIRNFLTETGSVNCGQHIPIYLSDNQHNLHLNFMVSGDKLVQRFNKSSLGNLDLQPKVANGS